MGNSGSSAKYDIPEENLEFGSDVANEVRLVGNICDWVVVSEKG